jgi:hypothetical protein
MDNESKAHTPGNLDSGQDNGQDSGQETELDKVATETPAKGKGKGKEALAVGGPVTLETVLASLQELREGVNAGMKTLGQQQLAVAGEIEAIKGRLAQLEYEPEGEGEGAADMGAVALAVKAAMEPYLADMAELRARAGGVPLTSKEALAQHDRDLKKAAKANGERATLYHPELPPVIVNNGEQGKVYRAQGYFGTILEAAKAATEGNPAALQTKVREIHGRPLAA